MSGFKPLLTARCVLCSTTFVLLSSRCWQPLTFGIAGQLKKLKILKLKLFMELYRQMTASAEALSSTKYNNVKEGKRGKGENQDTGKRQPEVLETRGPYIIGGSAFGWNFITFPSDKPVYYGPRKESFRAS
ncbi:uncharacterized protein LOC115743105 [Rhodamnia argentea]|uniref:Uncharacterized protein LOC115743105 n=1 Tax=Rhodamnia argentea TaxID=178133 RepID=A0A8B8PHI0_9MYRT|nr:uncharacterized protein LOC115743105 [Rhodamnia argentea]